MTGLFKDLRFALRMLIKSPGFAIIAVLTIGAGIGANTAMFSIIDTVLIRSLPYANADELALIWGIEGGQKSGSNWNSYPDYVEFEEQKDRKSVV